jgi:GxxExxY protein
VYELRRSGLAVVVERAMPLVYEDVRLDCGYRLDIVANDSVIIEVKSVKETLPIHLAQALTYLKLSAYPLALLMNFNVPVMVHGIQRLVNPRFAPDRVAPVPDR